MVLNGLRLAWGAISFFCLHLHYTMKLWTFEQSRWAKGMLLDLASHIATTDMCQFKIASSKLCQIFCGWHSAGKIPWSPMDHICQSWRLQGRIARPLWIIHPWFNVCLAQGHEGSRARVWSNLLSEKRACAKGLFAGETGLVGFGVKAHERN